MRHIDADNGYANLDAGAYLLETPHHSAAETVQLNKEVVIEIKDIIDFLFGDAKDVTADDGIDIEESQAMFGFGDFVAGNLACNDT